MQVKTFKAGNMPEALRLVKSEFGPDALILSSRKERRQGFLGRFTKPYFEVTAAMDMMPHVAEVAQPERSKGSGNTMEEFQRSMLAPMARELKDLRAKVETLTVREKVAHDSAPPQPQTRRSTEWETHDRVPFSAMLPGEEVEDLKKVLQRAQLNTDDFLRETADEHKPVMGLESSRLEVDGLTAELRSNGVEESAISQLLVKVSDAAARGESAQQLRALLNKSIAADIYCAGMTRLKNNSPRILALVGPTGVGKTTTIAKLAALASKQGLTVAMITIDTFRVGAVAQLQTYADIIGIPLTVAATPAELQQAIADHEDKQLIFIDTAGGSPRDRKRVNELKSFLDVIPALEVHLCLAATTRDAELSQAVDRFSVLPVSRMIFTKLDESMSYGCLVNTHLRNRLPFSYFTTGQKVPEDIETATSQRVADLVLRETKS